MVSTSVLAFMWYGVLGVVRFRNVDLSLVFWPSSEWLTIGWRTTIRGIMITILSVATNCVLYAGVAVALDILVRRTARYITPGIARS